jgi:geranylgeranyl reductase
MTCTFPKIIRDKTGTHVHYRHKESGEARTITCNMVIGADGARSSVAKAEVPGGDKLPYVVHDGKISPDFDGWVFPHGKSACIGMTTCVEGVDLKKATADLRASTGLTDCKTIRRAGAPTRLSLSTAGTMARI